MKLHHAQTRTMFNSIPKELWTQDEMEDLRDIECLAAHTANKDPEGIQRGPHDKETIAELINLIQEVDDITVLCDPNGTIWERWYLFHQDDWSVIMKAMLRASHGGIPLSGFEWWQTALLSQAMTMVDTSIFGEIKPTSLLAKPQPPPSPQGHTRRMNALRVTQAKQKDAQKSTVRRLLEQGVVTPRNIRTISKTVFQPQSSTIRSPKSPPKPRVPEQDAQKLANSHHQQTEVEELGTGLWEETDDLMLGSLKVKTMTCPESGVVFKEIDATKEEVLAALVKSGSLSEAGARAMDNLANRIEEAQKNGKPGVTRVEMDNGEIREIPSWYSLEPDPQDPSSPRKLHAATKQKGGTTKKRKTMTPTVEENNERIRREEELKLLKAADRLVNTTIPAPLPHLAHDAYPVSEEELAAARLKAPLNNISVGPTGQTTPENYVRLERVILSKPRLWTQRHWNEKPPKKQLDKIKFDLLHPPNWGTRVTPQNPGARAKANEMIQIQLEKGVIRKGEESLHLDVTTGTQGKREGFQIRGCLQTPQQSNEAFGISDTQDRRGAFTFQWQDVFYLVRFSRCLLEPTIG